MYTQHAGIVDIDHERGERLRVRKIALVSFIHRVTILHYTWMKYGLSSVMPWSRVRAWSVSPWARARLALAMEILRESTEIQGFRVGAPPICLK